MMSKNLVLFTLFSLCILDFDRPRYASADDERKPYIVYMGELPEDRISLMDVHHNLLAQAIGDETIARNSKIHSYGQSFNGFAARLLPHEARRLSQKKGIVSVFRSRTQHLLTTRSWDFLGMSEKLKRNQLAESNIIVALLDTGIWVESPSFNDMGFGPPPQKWKGKCQEGGNFTGCNNKVIGAQYFNLAHSVQPYETTPVDTDGHGTHTASTAAGVFVERASLYGIAEGTARGGAPSARIASYKVCWASGCEDVDILAAFDAAIADGVDVISVSIGGASRSFTQDPIAIGSFHASRKGILTVCAAGNEGPNEATVQNAAPWIMTVAASTIDRQFHADVKLGNGEKISGIAVNTFSPGKEFYPLTNGAQSKNFSGDLYGNASACDYGSLRKDKVIGKIVYCQGAGGDTVVRNLGGAGTIMSSNENLDTAFATIAIGTYISVEDGKRVDKYINSTRSAQAVIYKTRSVEAPAPAVASFSSRGPSRLSPNILKPDISAPGVNILAAYSKFTTVTGEEGDDRVVKFNIESGTSMACPHVAGAAAYVKSFHPRWSPAAIKSALMTTSKPMKIKPVEAELASGSGEINPRAAVHPGLVYDIGTDSYVSFLCKQGYNSKDVTLITGSKNYNCSNITQAIGADGLNYPSIHLKVDNTNSVISAVFYRTVTNVGIGRSTYVVDIEPPEGLTVEVTPNILRFFRLHQKKSFKVTLEGKNIDKNMWYLPGSISWSDSKHHVRSPILVSFPTDY
ncbi:Subtilisin-like protease SBT4.15 [Sesamum angolense]|uniref:Subtilisin-like protease SBT4.15 n=1 Tax=Sesamum angolense TaxID=2727404 RepID=A0AAE1WF24_9LAMI|nr:Subtilisin-like protease SBT4.15 [Sesamum angolense]